MDVVNDTLLETTFTPLSPTVSIICGTVILLIALPGLLLYVLFIHIVLTRKRFQSNSFFIIAGWLGVAECTNLVILATYSAPCLITQDRLVNSRFIGAVLNIGWFSGLPLTLFLAVNRYLCICRSNSFKGVFTVKRSKYYSMCCWLFGLAVAVPSFTEHAPLYFDIEKLSWGWQIDNTVAKVVAIGEVTMVSTVTLMTYILNGLVFKYIHDVQKNLDAQPTHLGRRCIREQKIFIQFFITTIWLLIFDIPFIIVSYSKEPSRWLGYFVTMAYTINCSINGLVYAALNECIRREIKRIYGIFCCRASSKNEISTVRNLSDSHLQSINTRDHSPNSDYRLPNSQL